MVLASAVKISIVRLARCGRVARLATLIHVEPFCYYQVVSKAFTCLSIGKEYTYIPGRRGYPRDRLIEHGGNQVDYAQGKVGGH
jgi:hypothetical protein